MNGYYNFQNYFDSMNAMNMNQMNPHDNFQTNFKDQQKEKQPMNQQMQPELIQNKLYNPYQGFIRGNMFPGLYDPYRKADPYEIKPMNKQAELLTELDALGFAMIDLNLYLDLYPNDQQMLNTFNQIRKQKAEKLEQYEKQYGPITIKSNSLNRSPWAWDNKPWPWQ